jgi:hypothetical protein
VIRQDAPEWLLADFMAVQLEQVEGGERNVVVVSV